MWKKFFYQKTIELTNNRTTSKLLQLFATSKMSKHCIASYSKLYHIDMRDVVGPMNQFQSLQQFFTRELKEEARPIDAREQIVTSPVDGKIESFGDVTAAQHYVVKGKEYSLLDVFGNEDIASSYVGGQYIVFYLSPSNYHRVHSPVDGQLMRQYFLGSKSYPVNQLGLTYGKKPLSHNYRCVTELQTQCGKMAVVKVGAMFVNSIQLTEKKQQWTKGDEVGLFEFGSTVMVFFEKGKTSFTQNVQKDAIIRVGEAFTYMV